ncbi:amidohydrolase family protein [Rhodohalobacter sp. 614A]|uniref:amidohydrolase family protein n=1 Tax=Rhodohalobacter sp. 614A TaxID=2908649 RepID=UPI001F1591A8|nr:amidohydrolase family protein [Rhodohalobacter sp. 614A]
MRSFKRVFLMICVIFPLFATTSFAQSLVIKNVQVLTMENDQVRQNQTIMIKDGWIEWVGPDSEAEYPDDATIVEGYFYVMPGLAEMHAHIPSPDQGEQAMLNTLVLYLSQGMTTIRGMLGDPVHLELRARAEESDFLSPRILTSGPSFNGNSATSPEISRQMVRDQVDAGYNLLKFHPGITLENFSAITDEANSLGIEFSGHISEGIGLERSLEAGQGTIDHFDKYLEFLADDAEKENGSVIYFGYEETPRADISLIENAAQMTEDASAWVVPTNTLLENVFNPELSVEEMQQWPGMEYMSEDLVNGWTNFVRQLRNSDDYNEEQARQYLDIRKELTLSVHEHGSRLLLGADAPQIFNPPGFAAHRELELMVESGLTPFQALQTGTVNVGRYLHEEDTVGKIAAGYRADLILLDVNPLKSIPFQNHIQGVIYRGNYLNSQELRTLLNNLRN